MGHDIAGEGDVFELIEGDGFDEEGYVGFAAGDQADGFVGFADIADVAEAGDGFLVQAEELVEDDAVELDDVELALAGREVGECGGDYVGFGGQKVVAVACGGQEGCAPGVIEGVDVGGVEFLDIEVGAGLDDEVRRAEAFETVDDSVGGKDGDAGSVHIDEGHHHGGFGESGCGEMAGREILIGVVVLVEGEPELGAAFLGVGDGGFVAMVAVGDDELLVGHGGDDEVDEMGIGERPDAVDDAVLVGDGEVGGVVVETIGASGAEDELLRSKGGVGVEHVNLFAVGSGGLEEAHAVGLVLGESLLVAVNDLVGVVVEVAEGDEAAALADFGGFGVGVGQRCRGWE